MGIHAITISRGFAPSGWGLRHGLGPITDPAGLRTGD
jgi:hypothetical protein